MSDLSHTDAQAFSEATAADQLVFASVAGREADTLQAEIAACMDRISQALADKGTGPGNIAKLTVYLRDIASQPEADAALDAWFGAGPQPVVLCLGAGLPGGDRVRIEAIAAMEG